MAGQVSIPVRNRSGRVIAVAGFAALIVATSQWAYWAGLANWDLLSLIPGFARATNLTANQYPGEDGFACENKSIGSKANLMSDELKQSVGQALCSDGPSLETAALRGSDGTLTLRVWKSRRNTTGRQFDRIAAPMLRAALVEPKRITLASIDLKSVEKGRDLFEEIDGRSRRRPDLIAPVDPIDDTNDIDPEKPIDEVDLRDDDHSGPGRDGSDDRDDDRDDDDNSGPGSGDDLDDHSGSSDGHEEFETAEEDRSGSGSDGEHDEEDRDDDDSSGSGSDDDNSGSGSSDSGSGHS